MADVVPVITEIGKSVDGSIKRIVWSAITATNNTCSPVNFPGFADKSIQTFGTFNNTTVALHGSNDGGTSYAALNDPGGTAIGMTVAGIKAVLENTEFIKPVLASIGVNTNMNVAMVIRLANPLRT